MKMIRSYLVFTSFVYRIGVLVAIPVALTVFSMLSSDFIVTHVSVFSVWVFTEVFSDFWVFGGICSKEYVGFEYMKTSSRGRQVLKQAILGDCGRKILWIVFLELLLIGVGLCSRTVNVDSINYICIIASVFLTHGCIMTGNLIGRYITFYPLIILIASGSMVLLIILQTVAMLLPVVMLVAGLCLSAGSGWLSTRNVMKKMEESYYDERSETGISYD